MHCCNFILVSNDCCNDLLNLHACNHSFAQAITLQFFLVQHSSFGNIEGVAYD